MVGSGTGGQGEGVLLYSLSQPPTRADNADRSQRQR